MTEPLNDKQIDRLIADYLAGSLSAAALPYFERWLRASPEHPRRVARLSVTDFCIREVCQDTKADYLLDVLNQIDDAAGPAQLVTLHNFEQPSWHRYRLPLAIGGAIAAVLAVAVTLIITLQQPASGPDSIANTTTPNMPAASTQSTPRGSDPLENQTVATITATHNAQWASPQAEGASAPVLGSKLTPGTRLTLTAGFAEITTNRGAIAILEAPATIELLNNDNALRLHSGKLVGICETESAKGFLVRTPHMDITDLGTRFGVNASRNDATEVHVLDGEIEVLRGTDTSAGPTVRQRLTKGQAVRASSGTQHLAAIPADQTLFRTPPGPQNTLLMTGIGLQQGEVDPAWRVVAVGGKPINAGGELRAHADTTPGGEGDTGPMFLKIDDALLLAYERSGVFTCRSTFVVPSSFDPETHRLVVWVEGDHRVSAIRINGQPMTVPANVTQLISVAFEHTLTPGRQQIEIDIQEMNSNKQLRSGLRAKLELQLITKGNPSTKPR